MNHPFITLNVPLNCSDADVRSAYQTLLRKFSPEHRPEEFQQIQEAYQTLKTERDRWTWRLCNLKENQNDPMVALEEFVHLPSRFNPPGALPFRAFLKSCSVLASKDLSKKTKKP